MSYRSLSPITGYTGHIPGEKWLVGSNTRRSHSWHRGQVKNGTAIGGTGGMTPTSGADADIGFIKRLADGVKEISLEDSTDGRRKDNASANGNGGRRRWQAEKTMKEESSREEEDDKFGSVEEEEEADAEDDGNMTEAEETTQQRRRRGREWNPADERVGSGEETPLGHGLIRKRMSSHEEEVPSTGRSKPSEKSHQSEKFQSESEAEVPVPASTRTMSPAEKAIGRGRVSVTTTSGGEEAALANGTDNSSSGGGRQNGQRGSRRRRKPNGISSRGAEKANSATNGLMTGERHPVMDVFEDAQGGWWSEGQALKNLRAHSQAIGGERVNRLLFPVQSEPASGSHRNEVNNDAGWMPMQPSPAFSSDHWDANVPMPGYSGHLTELYQTSVGKSFGVAARESKRRQRHYQDGLTSGGGTFLSSTDSSGHAKSKESGRNGLQDGNKISPY